MPSFSSFPFLCLSSFHHGRPNTISCYNHRRRATFVEGAKMKWVRERGLDHAVEKEKHLRPLLSLKNLIVSEPSKSLPPLHHLRHEVPPLPPLPRHQIHSSNLPPPPPITAPASASPQMFFASTTTSNPSYHSCAGDAADRLLRVLMITPDKKLPLPLIERLRFDLGLLEDYARSLLPDFPDYFQVSPLHGGAIKHLRWSKAFEMVQKSWVAPQEHDLVETSHNRKLSCPGAGIMLMGVKLAMIFRFPAPCSSKALNF